MTLLFLACTCKASTEIPLWPEGIPQARPAGADAAGLPSDQPTLTVFRPAVPNGTAVVIAPGGGYSRLSMDKEGYQYARWLNTLGVSAFVLKYRTIPSGHPGPLQDLLRAIRLLRTQAAAYGIDPGRIGVMGSSAGGHLAASAGTLFDHPFGKTGAALDAVDARPNFLVLLYPVITFTSPAMHQRSRDTLLGQNAPAQLVEQMSVEKQVSARTPPTILIHTAGDMSVPAENSILFYQALARNKVAAELHIFEQGGHGVGMRADLGTTSAWPERVREWMQQHKLVPASRTVAPAPAPVPAPATN